MKAEWIKTSEKMPDLFEEVLVVIKWRKIPVQAYWTGKEWKASFEVTDAMRDGHVEDRRMSPPDQITFWTPLPETPDFSVYDLD
jgi:hypothetical protein